MAKFITHDGKDTHGIRAEVLVQTGTGTVKELNESGDNVQAVFKVEGFQHPVKGWTSTKEAIYPMLVAAKEQGREVSYRIESQRKRKVDRSIPINDLRPNQETAKENTVVLLVGIDGTLTSEAVTNPAEDPHSGGRIPATEADRARPDQGAPATGGFTAEQALTGLANARKGGLDPAIVNAAAALALAAGASVNQVLSAGVEEQGEPQRRQPQRAVAKEAAPYVAYNTDGRPNLGSYMVQAAVGAESLAADIMATHNLAVAEQHNAAVAAGEVEGEPVEPQPVDFRNAAALGRVFLNLADAVQVAVSDGGRSDRMATSHTRARSLVYDAIKSGRHPVPLGADAEAQTVWREAVVEEATMRFRLALAIAVPQPEEAAQAASGESQQPQPEADAAQGQPEAPVDPQVAQQVVERFAGLAQAAGFAATPDSPVVKFLNVRFGVSQARLVPTEALLAMVEYYASQGAEGPANFHAYVTQAIETAPAPAPAGA